MKEDLSGIFTQDIAEETPTNSEMASLAVLAEEQLNLERLISDTEEVIDSLKAKLKQIQEIAIPEVMASIGMKEFKLDNGMKLTIKDDVYASIRKDYIIKAVDWLDSIGLGDIVKDKVEVNFGRGDSIKAKALLEICSEKGYDATETLSVHPQTLKATVKEQLARGVQFPEEFFSIAPVRKSIIKLK